ncbi:putative GABA permease [Xylariaceae sp. FL0804]|nr:putative GABA permease [Xylariaceae sp. FL0804]
MLLLAWRRLCMYSAWQSLRYYCSTRTTPPECHFVSLGPLLSPGDIYQPSLRSNAPSLHCSTRGILYLFFLLVCSTMTSIELGVTGDSKQASGHTHDYDPSHDEKDMYRLGKTQELRRRFRYFSIAGYVVVLGGCWEFAIVTSVFNIANGGTAGAIWTTVLVCLGMMLVVVSMAEVASMAPTSGGQYHWVSEIAPPRLQKQVSYAVGWLAMLGWQAGVPSSAYIFASQIIALISFCNPNYVPQGWHSALLTIASAVVTILLSVFVMQRLAFAQGLAVAAHCLGFVAFVAVLWGMGPGAGARETFFHFEDQNGWGSLGIATLIGVIGPVSTFVGGDSAVHLAEELQDAAYVLPRAMVVGSAFSYILGAIAMVSFMFNIGTIDGSLYRYNDEPWIAVLYRITESRAATIVLVTVVAVNFFFMQINSVLTSSRQLWAFARDKGVPYHQWVARVDRSGLPRNAVVVTLIFTALICLIIIGSASAFNTILAFSTSGVNCAYFVILLCILWRRYDKSIAFPPTRYSLGRWGLPINTLALVYILGVWGFCLAPPVPHPDPSTMNWSSLLLGGILVIAFTWYLFRARYEYDGPVEYVRKNF